MKQSQKGGGPNVLAASFSPMQFQQVMVSRAQEEALGKWLNVIEKGIHRMDALAGRNREAAVKLGNLIWVIQEWCQKERDYPGQRNGRDRRTIAAFSDASGLTSQFVKTGNLMGLKGTAVYVDCIRNIDRATVALEALAELASMKEKERVCNKDDVVLSIAHIAFQAILPEVRDKALQEYYRLQVKEIERLLSQ